MFVVCQFLKVIVYGFLQSLRRGSEMASYLWRKYSEYLYTKWERTILWDMIEPYRRSKSFTPLVTIYIAAFYTGVIGAAITEQRYKVQFFFQYSFGNFVCLNLLCFLFSLLFNSVVVLLLLLGHLMKNANKVWLLPRTI